MSAPTKTSPSHSINHDPAQYLELGYCIAPELVSKSAINQARVSLDRMIAGLNPDQRPEALVEPHVLAADWQQWLELCRTPAVIDAVQNCMQCEEVVLLMSHLIVKPAGDGLKTCWHQDNTYWPSVDGTDVTTVWLALDDVDVENAAMFVIPNTHAGFEAMEKIPTGGGDLLNVRVAVSAEMEASAVPCELRQGDASLHDSFIIHGSEANLSQRRRAGYTMRYGNAATINVDVEAHNKPVYYLRGDGRNLKPGYIDLRPGCAPPSNSGAEQRQRGEFGR